MTRKEYSIIRLTLMKHFLIFEAVRSSLLFQKLEMSLQAYFALA